jgi:hypothetical protein
MMPTRSPMQLRGCIRTDRPIVIADMSIEERPARFKVTAPRRFAYSLSLIFVQAVNQEPKVTE